MEISDIKQLVETPLSKYETKPRVEILIFHHSIPDVTLAAVSSVIRWTGWPYKLTIVDTSMYPAILAKIYNKYVKESECDYVAIVCSDSEVSVSWLEHMMHYMLTNKDIATIGPLTQKHVNQEMSDLVPKTGLQRASWKWASLPILLHNKKLFMEVGGYDERFFLYGHDPEIFRRFDKKGYKVYIDTDIVAEHRGGSTTKKVFSPEDIDVIGKYNQEIWKIGEL